MDVLLASKLLVILISLTLRTFIVCFLLTSFISLCKNKPFVFIFILLLNILNYRLMIHESTQSYSHLSAWYIVFLSVEFGSLKCSDEPVLWQIAHGRSVYDIRHKAHLSDVEKNRSVNMYARRCQCSLIPGSHRGFTDCSLSWFFMCHVVLSFLSSPHSTPTWTPLFFISLPRKRKEMSILLPFSCLYCSLIHNIKAVFSSSQTSTQRQTLALSPRYS